MQRSNLLRFFSVWIPVLLIGACAITDEQKVTYGTFRGGAGAVSWSPDGKFFAVANTIGIWVFSTHSLEEIAVLASPSGPDSKEKYDVRHGWGNNLVFLENGQLASTGMGATVTVWEIESEQETGSYDLPEEAGFAICLAVSPSSGELAIGTSKGDVGLLQPGGNTGPKLLEGFEGIVHDLQFSDDGRYLGAVGGSDELIIWDLENGSEYDRLPTPHNTMEIERMGEPGQFLIAGETVEVWNYIDQQKAQAIEEPNLVGQKTAWVVLNVLSMWPVPIMTAQQEHIVPCKRAVAVSRDGRLLADVHPGTMKEVIRIIELESQEVITTLNPRGGMTCDLKFSPDGNLLLIANQRGAHIYETESWEASRIKLSDVPATEIQTDRGNN